MKKLLAAVLAASMCLSYATFASAAQSSRGVSAESDSQFKVEFSATGGTVTAKVLDSGIESGALVDSGKIVTFTAKGTDTTKEYTAAWTGVEAEASNPLVAKLTVTKAATVSVKLTEKAAPAETEYAITFPKPDNGVLTATKDDADFAMGGKAKKGDVINFTVVPEEGYEVDAWTNATEDASDKTKATLTVAETAVTVSVTLKAKTTGNEFTVKIDKETKGGLLDILDTTANKYLPVGEDVKIPKGNKLKIDWSGANGATLDKLIVNGVSGAPTDTITVDKDLTLSATFKASTPGEVSENYSVWADPSDFVSAEPLTVSGTLSLWYYDKAEDKELTGATFAFSAGEDQEDNAKFNLTAAGVFTSKEKLPDGHYYMMVDAAHGGTTHEEKLVYISIIKEKLVRVGFYRYIADDNRNMSIPNAGKSVSKGTKFSAVEKPAVPAMYNHESEAWKDRKGAIIANDFAINGGLSAYVTFKGYSVTMLGLDGKPVVPENPDEPDPVPPTPPSGGGSSGGGGGGGSALGGGSTGSSSGSSTVSTGTATKEATKAVENAVKAAVSAGSKSANAAVTFKNVKSMTPDAFKAVNAAAAKASKGVAVKTSVQMDTVVNGKVEARMYIDPTLAAGLKTAIKTTVDVSPKSKENTKAASVVSKYFSNTAAVVSFAQQGAFGMNVQAAVKVDTSKMDTKTLKFFSYDAKANKFTEITAPAYFVDSAGYLHFTTPVGGSIVITDKALARK